MHSSTELGRLLLARYGVLQALTQTPQTKRDLVDDLSIPRSTLDDIIRDLSEAELVTFTKGQWYTTIIGQCMVQVHEEYLAQLTSLSDISSITDVLDSKSPLDSAFLIGADLNDSRGPVPDEVMHVLLEAATTATRFRIFTPSAISAYVKPFYDRVTNGDDSCVEVVVSSTLFEQLYSLHPNLMSEAVDNPCISFFSASIPFSFGLWIADNAHAGVIIFEEGGISGILVNDSVEALNWAENQYEQIRKGTPVLLSSAVIQTILRRQIRLDLSSAKISESHGTGRTHGDL
ncbi:helix-turn-helix transcriptional regulator [Halomarina pelagica]|uniref:helix-turn-helix transcriptional regulator n=1 Tax=Halomarina pelagica TaxID=2961599 RepID=UPI0020C3E07D|nr:hypothetical protein [Halomarina sp. BND7]